MENFLKVRSYLFSVMLAVTAYPIHAMAGGMDPGGGDAYAAEFVSIGHQLVRVVTDLKGNNLPFTFQQFEQAIAQTEVVSLERVFLNGSEKDAVNYPAVPKIEMGRERWDQIEEDAGRRYRLVMHEYLGIMGVDDRDYQVSGAIVANVNRPVSSVFCTFSDPSRPRDPARYQITATSYDDAPAVVRGIVPRELGGRLFTRNAYIRMEKGASYASEITFGTNFGTYVLRASGRRPILTKLTVIRDNLPPIQGTATCRQSRIGKDG